MHVQAGEIVDAWMEVDEKDMNKILDQNKHHEKYWVVLFQNCFPGKSIKLDSSGVLREKAEDNKGIPFVRTLKAFYTKPRPMVGSHIAEIDNRIGKITWRSYPKDIPIKWGVSDKLHDEQLKQQQLIYECDIPSAYIYNKPE